MKKQAVTTDKAAAPKAPYSQGIVYGDLLFVSGAGPIDPETQQFISGTIEEEAEATLKNVKNIVEAAGFSMDNLLKVTVFLKPGLLTSQRRPNKFNPKERSLNDEYHGDSKLKSNYPWWRIGTRQHLCRVPGI